MKMEKASMINVQEIMDIYSRCLAKMREEGQVNYPVGEKPYICFEKKLI